MCVARVVCCLAVWCVWVMVRYIPYLVLIKVLVIPLVCMYVPTLSLVASST